MNRKFLIIANNLIKHSEDNSQLAFVHKTKVHAMIVFFIFGSKKITFEQLCKKLVNTTSRSTIQSILNEGVDNGYFTKYLDKIDKRKKYYECQKLSNTLEKWLNENKTIFSN